MISALLLFTLAQTQMDPSPKWEGQPDIRPRVYRSDGPHRLTRLGADDRAPLCEAISVADKAGAWDCMRGDGTMQPGSATTFVATGTPTNTIENGFAVRSYGVASNDQQPADAAFPQTDFSVCIHHRSATLNNVQLAGFGTGTGAASSAILPFELQPSGNFRSFASNGVSQTGPSYSGAPLPITVNNWFLLCLVYTRVGGAADNITEFYVNGVLTGTSSTNVLIHALSSRWVTNGAGVGGAGANPKDTRGFFVTYKRLLAADIAGIYARLAP